MNTPIPADPASTEVPAGWHPDPWRQAPLRWWDGRAWTSNLSGPAPMHSHRPLQAPVDPLEQVGLAEGTAAWHTKLVLLMPVVTLGSIIGFGVAFGRIFDLMEEIDTSPGADADAQFEQFFDSFGTIASGFAALQILNLLGVAVLVMRMVWTYRIVNAARVLGRGGTREPGLASASWIIPIINLWWPYQTMRDVFPADQRPANRLITWWVTYLLGAVAIGFTVFAIFLPLGGLIAVGVLAAIPSAISAVLERRLIIDATALVRRDVESR